MPDYLKTSQKIESKSNIKSIVSGSFHLDKSNKSISNEMDSKLNLEEDDFNLNNMKIFDKQRRGQSITNRSNNKSDKMIDSVGS